MNALLPDTITALEGEHALAATEQAGEQFLIDPMMGEERMKAQKVLADLLEQSADLDISGEAAAECMQKAREAQEAEQRAAEEQARKDLDTFDALKDGGGLVQHGEAAFHI